MFYFFDPTMVLLIPAILLTIYAQGKVHTAYSKYLGVPNRRGITGAQAARKILDRNGLSGVRIERVSRELADHYDPRKKVMRLSPGVHDGASVASVAIAAHESGHAIQHARGYAPLTVRNGIAPVVSLVSSLAWPLLLIGLLMSAAYNQTQGMLIFDIGVAAFCAVVVFQLITLPVEFNASKRALVQLTEGNIIGGEEEKGAKKVLSAAALTYVAALAVAVANLMRILVIRGRNN